MIVALFFGACWTTILLVIFGVSLDLVDNLDTSRIENPTDTDLKRSKKYARAYAFIKKAISKL